jgi:hypothetical protein
MRGESFMAERIFGEVEPYDIVAPIGPWEGQALCTSLANADRTTSSNGMFCGTVTTTTAYWKSDYGPFRVYGAAMNLSGSSGPIGGDSGAPIYQRYTNDQGSRRIPVGVVNHERIPCGDPDADGQPTNQCGNDLYFAEVKQALEAWSGVYIWKD